MKTKMTIIQEGYGDILARRGDDVFPHAYLSDAACCAAFDDDMRQTAIRYMADVPADVSAESACERLRQIDDDLPEGYDISARLRSLDWSFREESLRGDEWVAVPETRATEVPDLGMALSRWSKATGVLARPEASRATDAMGDFLCGLFGSLRVLAGMTSRRPNMARAVAQAMLRKCGAALDVLRAMPVAPCREAEAYQSLIAAGFTRGDAGWSQTPAA